ncbi:TonB-dependent receptor domain-containing protein [Sphingosinicella sp. CPCC 101087]|uniref:TonB-dependent receptor domain-containing protein n=1 Tax=Sphingosinicella sp. CPCC 101087 TaxID=2497754 RepID=UPI00101BBFDF|nr:TonB-dependent receptor [Sphingosinicella sp. CPCC 101087]
MKTTFRQRLLTSTLLIGAAGFATPAFAQDETTDTPSVQAEADFATDAQDPAGGEAIIVTGSRIARRDLTATSPMAVVQDEEFQLSGAVNVEQVINTLPQVIPGATSFSNNPGGGVATLNLRGLGAQRNLVLVNGRRYIFFDTNQIVDLNSIPQFLIDSVDVVTGGASAVYGSDALAGVVNFRLRTDLDGIIAGAQYNITEEGDGERYNAYVAIGTQFADGRGHVTAYAEYYKRGSVMAADRGFSRFSLTENADATGLVPGGSAGVPQGRFVAVNPVIDGAAFNVSTGTNYAGPLGAFFGNPGRSTAYVDADAYNYAPANYLMVPQERWTLGGYAEYEVAEGVNAYTEVAFINNRVQNELAATPITQNVDIDLAAHAAYLDPAELATLTQIAANQQAAIAAAAAAGEPNPYPGFNAGAGSFPALQPGFVRLQVNSRTTAVGSRNNFDDRNAFRVLAGLRGDLTETLTYDVYYMYARTRNAAVQSGNISRSAFTRLVGDGTCNPFGADQFSADCVSQISILAQNQDISQLQVAQASISGPLFQIGWANDPVAFAAGVEWRSMRGEFIPDTALASGDVAGFNAGQPTSGSYQAREAFAEIRVPIIQDGFISRLELNGAARYSDYSLDAVGGVWTYAGGAELAPIPDITFRGQFQRAIRAPNVEELFGGQQVGFPPAIDPCATPAAAADATVRALCVATGVPDFLVGNTGLQPNPQIEGTFGGNPNLEEEVADTWTVGAVIRPRFIPRLNIAVDYYNIKIENAIAQAGGGVGGVLDLCYNVIQDASHPICGLITRDAGGSISGGGVFIVEANNANLSSVTTEGIDFQVDYTQPLGFSAFGEGESRLNFFFMGNYSWENAFVPVVGVDSVTECSGRFGNLCQNTTGNPTPKWKWSSRLSWMDGPVTTSVRWRHVGSVSDDDDTTDFFIERIGAYDVFDLSFGFNVNDNLTLNMGVQNLFDKKPPLLGDNQEQSNTYPGTYDVLGRDFFISANLRF